MLDAPDIQTPHIRLSNLRYSQKGRELVSVPDLEVGQCGVTAVMGSNGAGKSLLLRLMHGLIAPTDGRVFHFGKPASAETRMNQSFVFQTPVLLRRTAKANVSFVLKARGVVDTNAGELLERVGLSERSSTPARRLSGGEKQRLAIAQALATNPKTLFLDEPTASLDPASVLMIEEILKEAVSNGVRIIIVTHEAMQAKRLADDVVFLASGKVVEQSDADSFFNQPKTTTAQNYLSGRL